MAIALFPGTFDPVTNGHLDLIQRASLHFDHLIVAVGTNIAKQPWFSIEQRISMLRDSLPPRIEVVAFEGLLLDFARQVGARCVVKGIRSAQDFDFEQIQAITNRQLGGLETMLLPAAPQWGHVSSSLVRELAAWNGDYSRYVPDASAVAIAAISPSKQKGTSHA